MAQIIQRYDAVFTAIDTPVTLAIPRGSQELEIRVNRAQAEVTVRVLQDFPSAVPPSNYERTFQLILAEEPVPATYKKYIGSIPFGPGLVETHIVEISNPVATVTAFEIEQTS